jgi:alanine dehydrogenase
MDGVVHYCVTNIPAAVPRTSTFALTNATFPYVLKLAQSGVTALIQRDPGVREGVNTFKGHVTCPAVAQALNLALKQVADLL